MATGTFAFQSDEKISHGFFRVLGGLSAEAEKFARSEVDAIETTHHARLLIKRMRALLWFARPALTEALVKRSKSDLRKASRFLSAQRDHTVTQQTLKIIAEKAGSPRDRFALKETLQHLDQKAAGAAQEKKALEAAMQILQKLTTAIKAGTPMTAKWPYPPKRLRKAARTTRKAEKKARKTKADLDFHEWRKKAKRLLYELELTEPFEPAKVKRALQHADKLQTKLGEQQDCVVLEKRLRNLRSRPPAAARTAKLVRKRKKRLRKESQKVARRLKNEL